MLELEVLRPVRAECRRPDSSLAVHLHLDLISVPNVGLPHNLSAHAIPSTISYDPFL